MKHNKRHITTKMRVRFFKAKIDQLEWQIHCLHLDNRENEQRHREVLNDVTRDLWSEQADHRVTLSELAKLREECGLNEFGHTVTIPPSIMVWLRMYTDKVDALRDAQEEVAGLTTGNKLLCREVMRLRVIIANVKQHIEDEELFPLPDGDIPF